MTRTKRPTTCPIDGCYRKAITDTCVMLGEVKATVKVCSTHGANYSPSVPHGQSLMPYIWRNKGVSLTMSSLGEFWADRLMCLTGWNRTNSYDETFDLIAKDMTEGLKMPKEAKCLVCAHVEPIGIWHPIGLAVCMDCRDKARAGPAKTMPSGTPHKWSKADQKRFNKTWGV